MTPTQQTVAAFAAALFEPDDLVEVRLLPSRAQRWLRASELSSPDVVAWLTERNQNGQNIYVGANPRARSGGTAEDVALARSVFVDFDGGAKPADALSLIRDAGLPAPSIVVNSGHGTHVYWLLDEPITDFSDWTLRQRGLIGLLNTDGVVHDAPRIMRLPGFLNVKAEPHVPCVLVEAHAERRYPKDDFPAAEQAPPAPCNPLPQSLAAATPDLLRRAEAYLDRIPPAISGSGGHSQTYAAATAMVHGFGLDTETAFALLWNRYNPRCEPPWTEQELRHKVEDAATKPHDKPYRWLADAQPPKPLAVPGPDSGRWIDYHAEGVAMSAAKSQNGVGGHGTTSLITASGMNLSLVVPAEPKERWQPKSARVLYRDHPELAPPLIEGLLRIGETANLIAAPKTGKSMIGLDLAISVATGSHWMSEYSTRAGQVLYIDNELHAATGMYRLGKLANARSIPLDSYGDRIFIEFLRGRLMNIEQLGSIFRQAARGQFSLVVIDAFYRTLPDGVEENDNAAMARQYNLIDQYAAHMEAAFVLIHHSSKGLQSGKGVTDVGSGAGAQSRAADAHLVVRPHEVEGALVLDGVVRSWAPPEPKVFRLNFPLFTPDTQGLDPSVLRTSKPRKNSRKGDDDGVGPRPSSKPWTPQEFVKEVGSKEPKVKEQLIQSAVAKGQKKSWAGTLLVCAVADGLLYEYANGPSKPRTYSTRPIDDPMLSVDRKAPEGGSASASRSHQPPEPFAPGGSGGEKNTPPPSPLRAPSTVDRGPPKPKRRRKSRSKGPKP